MKVYVAIAVSNTNPNEGEKTRVYYRKDDAERYLSDKSKEIEKYFSEIGNGWPDDVYSIDSEPGHMFCRIIGSNTVGEEITLALKECELTA